MVLEVQELGTSSFSAPVTVWYVSSWWVTVAGGAYRGDIQERFQVLLKQPVLKRTNPDP